MPGQPSGPQSSARNEALTVLVVGDDPLSLELLLTLRERGLEASAVPQALALEAVRSMAPDLAVVVAPTAEEQHQVLARLAEDATSALLPVVLVAEEQPSADARSFTHGVVAGIGRERGPDAIAELVLRTLVDLPQRSGESHGIVEETTLDELVGLLSRELRTGVLSVQGDAEARIVLRAGKPLGQHVDSFMEQVRPMLHGDGRLAYAFHEQASVRLDSIHPISPLDDESQQLSGRRVLVVHSTADVASAWMHALRDAGAQVVALSDAHGGFDAVRPLDPEVMLVDPAEGDGPLAPLLGKLRKDAQLRWTAALMAPMPPLGPGAEPSGDALAAVVRKIEELTAPMRSLEHRARHERSFETRLEQVGPTQLLRALLAADRRLRVRVRHPEAGVQVDVAQGALLGATAVRWDQEQHSLEGHAALGLLLALRSGRVHVEPIAGVVLDNLHMPLELALTMAGSSRQVTAPQSVAPQALVSQIPRAPRLPQVGRRSPQRLQEAARKAASLLLSPENEASSASRTALLVIACLIGAAVGLPAQFEPLQLGNGVAKVRLAVAPQPEVPTRVQEVAAGNGQVGLEASAPNPAQAETAARRCKAGDALYGDGKLLEAEAEYLHALVVMPDHPPALEGLVRVKLAQGDAAAATDWVLRLLARTPDDARVHLLLGDVHLAAGRRPSAVEAFRRAESLGSPEGRERLQQLAKSRQ